MAAIADQRHHCGEVYITNNYLMILECKFCTEKFSAYDKFLNHIFDNHFDNVDILEELNTESMEYDDDEEVAEQEYIDILTDTNVVGDSSYSAEISSAAGAKEFENIIDDENMPVKISMCRVNVDSQNETAQHPPENKKLSNPPSDTPREESSKFRSVVYKYPRHPGEERKYKCKFCGYDFANIINLRRHERRHLNNKPFPCAECNKRFFTRTELRAHIRRHTGERPFVCTYCGFGFVTNGALNIHEKRHLGERKHKCDKCEKLFYDGHQLRKHAVVHTRERNHKCNQCKATFTRIESLRNHMKLHENALRYECGICNMRFNQKPSLIWHEKSKHDIVRGGNGRVSNTLTTEITNDTADLEYECKRCKLEFKNKKSLLDHQSYLHADADAITTIEALEEAESETMLELL
ncbi:zinc finger protein OZF-like [Anastrepha ludens]|uniref:zinc finger protein OZF-like n=1 Tax=Anastrepha ludens TaxID=28586 RepID=UPI0023AF3A0A|nr:zinc finger protein OZF-like [Anastrepha ludens]